MPSKDAYRIVVAQVYALTGNLSHASQRLALLNDENPVHTLGQQAQRELGVGNDEEARALALLASALQLAPTDQTPVTTNTASAPTATSIGVPTQTLPALTPVPWYINTYNSVNISKVIDWIALKKLAQVIEPAF